MPLFARDLGVSPGELGCVIGVMGATRLLFNIPSAWAAERFGRRPLLAGGPLFTAAGMAGTATATYVRTRAARAPARATRPTTRRTPMGDGSSPAPAVTTRMSFVGKTRDHL